MATTVPQVIEIMLEQMGGRGLRGALVYVGASQLGYQAEREGYPSARSAVTPEGLIDYKTGVSFAVNGKRGKGWKMVVAYEPNDTYSVYLWQQTSREQMAAGVYGEILDSRHNVYCDELQGVIEGMYDEAIEKHNDGFINLD